MFVASRIVLLLVASVFLAQWQSGKCSGGNETRTDIDDEDEADEALENMNFDEFKERYRRLIPYMTYYVANNYVNSQVSGGVQSQQQPQHHQQQDYHREVASPTSQLIRNPSRLVPVDRPPAVLRRKPSAPRAPPNGDTGHKTEGKFVPSIQYDPKDVGGDTDYFTPVRYNAKSNYDTVEYSGTAVASRYREYERPPPPQQQQQQQRPQVYTEGAPSSGALLHQDSRYYSNERPLSRPYGTYYDHKYLTRKTKPPVAQPHDYILEYGMRNSANKATVSNADYNYPADNYESLRYASVEPPPRTYPKPTRILAQSVPRRPSLLPQSPIAYPTGHRPTASLDDIMKSLRLTDRLPEMLNNDNIDSSIKTLVEILGILHNAKQTSFRLPIANPNHYPNPETFKQTRVRPKVVTETRFQATPSPPIVHEEENIRYKPDVVYETRVKPKVHQEPNYEIVNNGKQENYIEYYTPLIHEFDGGSIEPNRKPTERPVKLDEPSEHTYEINEDLAEDIFKAEEEEKYSLPMTTEMPINTFKLADTPSHRPLPIVPPPAIKFGATRGRPNVDYPAYATIPKTEFNCKEQRYKGFFGDPSTDCQVWHYCDLNGGKSSFLCPNGTIFSQVALTCDWWFNVKCESTPQLYVLNERLYKYILPIMPKFPEDFSGPEVDRYLELKFKEMEAKLKEKKLKKQQEKNKTKEKLQSLEDEE